MQVLVIGTGQLSGLMFLAGVSLDIQIMAFDIKSQEIIHPLSKVLLNCNLNEAVQKADAITVELENIPDDILQFFERSGKLSPNIKAIQTGKDRRIEKAFLDKIKVQNVEYVAINNRIDFDIAIEKIGIPMILKSTIGGYDGKNQWRLTNTKNINAIWQELEKCITTSVKQGIIAEKLIPFTRELSIVGARAKNGTIVTYTLSENIHNNGILILSTTIKNFELQRKADKIFSTIVDKLKYVGILAVEFFDVNGRLLVNEIAPRVHNSGHWTQEGAETSQFENHLRAICDMSLGSTKLTQMTSMINILGRDFVPNEILAIKDCYIHWYQKKKRVGRKMGHINICAKSTSELEQKVSLLNKALNKR
ncbi:N5-carboxyaminoimidazole ribonucleotide synthase [Candidatus Photodesmus blepharus]|uniref:N5-carboxyaminoimidazole ribonucleotide synthase n=1 Tax=Candidatus Photodesmus blepharonis TaxID=1179155 RepID=A0A084CNE3_9GAMM|nr:5-(carboxyamino)imidazole ribonucleotide synthase [Candidatus Photodesmus blepharus]KEY91322.1 N5-carboxyaminoimidazole ribonucleotide synthase [Candidatus Photodesmus blepharus]